MYEISVKHLFILSIDIIDNNYSSGAISPFTMLSAFRLPQKCKNIKNYMDSIHIDV